MTIDSTAYHEISLPEMLADPIVQVLMASDGVIPVELEELIHSASNGMGDRKATAIANRTSRQRKPGRDRRLGR